jgi:hypothetical protein
MEMEAVDVDNNSGVVVGNHQGHSIRLAVNDATMQRAVHALEQFTR